MIRQRVRQFRMHRTAPGAADEALARHYLSGGLLQLFLAQEPRDVVHAANTTRWLFDHGHADPALIQAALLHDIGKGAQRRRDRVAHVLLSAAHLNGPAASDQSRLEWRRALMRAATHAHVGADRLAELGVTPRVVELVRRHHEAPGGDAMLELLQRADSAT